MGEKGIPGTLATLLSLTTDAVVGFDGAGRVLLANREAALLLSCTVEDLLGQDVRDFFPADASTTTAAPSADLLGLGADERPWPFPLDGTAAALTLRTPGGELVPVGVRCDRVSAPGETYLLVAESLDAERTAERENTRLVDELSQANRRLSGTLRIVLDTLDSQDVGVLFSRVLEELKDTMEASGTIIYLAEKDGFRLRGHTTSLDDQRVPQFMAFGDSIESFVTRAGHALRLRLVAPEGRELRQGRMARREVLDEETRELHRVNAQLLPPFGSFLCVPVWFGGHVISIIEVGWREDRHMRKEDARLLDAVAQYLSVELMAAFSSMRAERAASLDRLGSDLSERLIEAGTPTHEQFSDTFERICDELDAHLAVIELNEYQRTCLVSLPGREGDAIEMPFDLDELEEGYMEDGVAVVPVTSGSDLSSWLSGRSVYSLGALVDMGTLAGSRRCVMVLRSGVDEPLEDVDLTFLHRMADEVRAAVAGAEARSQDTHISQALQNGMRNELQRVDGITAHGLYSSATAAAFVGGDFYDLIRLPDRKACVILGDVSGKGVEAASVSAAVKTALGAYAWEGLAPAHMVRALNDFLMGFSRLETFATLFVGIVDLADSSLTYCSAGHPPALLRRASTLEVEMLDVQSGVVGAFREMAYHDGVIGLMPGDMLLLYTDGVTEARNPAGDFFGDDGLREAFMREAAGDMDGLLDRLLQTIDSYTERHLDDDVAMMSLRFDDLGDEDGGEGE
jgi:serine phosphatase RsbU (regulator of sigma subunit)